MGRPACTRCAADGLAPCGHVKESTDTDPRERSFDVTLTDREADAYTLRVRHLDSPHREAGSPTLVFLHDSLGAISVWRDFPDRLAHAAGCPAIVYDRRGYGRSSPFRAEPRTPGYLADEAAVLSQLLDRLGVERALLFGHSDGGSIALLAAAHHPERIVGTIVEAAHVFVEEVTLAGIREAREQLRTTDLRERLTRHHGELTDAVTSAWIDTWLSPAFRDWNIEASLTRIATPLLVLQGSDDEYGTPAQVDAIVHGVRGPVESQLLPGVAHTPHRSDPELVIDASVRFLRARGLIRAD